MNRILNAIIAKHRLHKIFPAAFLCIVPTSSAATIYSIVNLGPGIPRGINDSGQALTSNSFYQNGQATALPPGFSAEAINNLGQVAGYTGGAPTYTYQLDIYSNGVLNPVPAVTGVAPSGINNAGQVTGALVYQYKSFLYSGGVLTTIGPRSFSNVRYRYKRLW